MQAAFLAMGERCAGAKDVFVLAIAAEDSFMQQNFEAAALARAAEEDLHFRVELHELWRYLRMRLRIHAPQSADAPIDAVCTTRHTRSRP
eukprot:IDg67t1